MANLNIPFLLLQPATCSFVPTINTTRLYSFDRYTLQRQSATNVTSGSTMNHGPAQHYHRPINSSSMASMTSQSQRSQGENTFSKTKFEFGKYSTFDDTPRCLIVSGDQQSGTIVLWLHDSYTSRKPKQQMLMGSDRFKAGLNLSRVTKYLTSLVPRVALVPSISQNAGPLLDHCLIHSPAPSILNTSGYFIVTVHKDGIMRLWTTDDGRCVLASQSEIIPKDSKACMIRSLIKPRHQGGNHTPIDNAMNGIIVVTVLGSQNNGILFVNAYKMQIVSRIQHGIENLQSFNMGQSSRQLLIVGIDKVQIWKTQETKPQMQQNIYKGEANTPNQSLLLDVINTEDNLIAQVLNSFKLETTLARDSILNNRILAQKELGQESYIIAKQRTVEQYNKCGQCKELLSFPSKGELKFAKFLQVENPTNPALTIDLLMTVDDEKMLTIYSLTKLLRLQEQQQDSISGSSSSFQILNNYILFRANLEQDADLFDPFSVKTEIITQLTSLLTSKEEEQEVKLMKVKEQLRSLLNAPISTPLRFNKDESLLYTVMQIDGENQMVSWNLQSIIDNIKLSYPEQLSTERFPLNITPMRAFASTQPDQNPISLLNFQPLLIKSFYNKHQFEFFYSDEKVTDSVIYASSNHPSYLLGTSYGRIFMVSMFQETDEKVHPVLVIDSHHSSPITKLFIAYNPARKARPHASTAQRQGSYPTGSKDLLENGGHLISVSEDGTIAVTNLNSGEIHKALHNQLLHNSPSFEDRGIDRIDASRADRFFEQKQETGTKRRNSFAGEFSVNHYFQLIKVKSNKVFHYVSFGQIDKIVEVKNLGVLSEQIKGGNQWQNVQTATTGKSPSRQTEENITLTTQSSGVTMTKKPITSFHSLGSASYASPEEPPAYACISSDGGKIYIIQITNLSMEIVQLSGLDAGSDILGIYHDTVQNQTYVLSQRKAPAQKPRPKEEVKSVKPVERFKVPVAQAFQTTSVAVEKEKPKQKPQQVMQFYIFNSKSGQLTRRINDLRYAIDILYVKDILDYLLTKNEGFKVALQPGSNSIFDYETFLQFFKQSKEQLMGVGSHKLLDYLSLSLNLPLEYHPHNVTSAKYTKTMRDLLVLKKQMQTVIAGNPQKMSQDEFEECQRQVISALNNALFISNQMFKSDFNEDYFMKLTGVSCLQSQSGTIFGSSQQLLVCSTKQILKILQNKMAANASRQHLQQMQPALRATAPAHPHHNTAQIPPLHSSGSNIPVNQIPARQRSNSPVIGLDLDRNEARVTTDAEFELKEDEETKAPTVNLTPLGAANQPPVQQQFRMMPPLSRGTSVQSTTPDQILIGSKWPTRVLSLIHPFNVEVSLDDAIEKFLGLNLPFLDFRVGVQGAEESFSFTLTREDEDFHAERANPAKLIRMLRLSSHKRSLMEKIPKQKEGTPYLQAKNQPRATQHQQNNHHPSETQLSHFDSSIPGQIRNIDDVNEQIEMLLESEPQVRFFGSENWKLSSYMSTVLPGFFLAILTALVDYAKEDVTFMLQEWLFIIQRINQQRTINESCRISLSAASKILLKKEPCISAAGRDVFLKPVLYALATTPDRLSGQLEEWTALVLDTYKKLKKETTLRATYGESSSQQSSLQGINQSMQSQQSNPQSTQASSQAAQDKRLVNQYFGELEMRGLVCISYFALYNHDQLDSSLKYRVSKLTTILTREIVEKFNNDRRYIHLLTHLLQLLSTWMKMHNDQFNSKAMIGEVIRLLLFIYNINKSPLNRESVITRVTGENFYLIKPTQPELYLKLTAAKALLEIGENYTHDFLSIIQEEATHLNQGGEYQQNVLEILKIFINSSGTAAATAQHSDSNGQQQTVVNLEHHLIQITQILLKCFDPNELALRKNSHRIVSIILSIMVKMFPMVAFHHESQRLAVGTHDGPIAIYDMRTSAKWKILEGHTGNITCLAFDSKGNLLASYSAVDRTLQLWKVGNTGFFSTIMGGTSKSSNKIALRPLGPGVRNPHPKAHNHNQDASMQRQSEYIRNNSLLDGGPQQTVQPMASHQVPHSSNSKRVNICSVKFILPKEKEVELQREDGLKEKHKLVK